MCTILKMIDIAMMIHTSIFYLSPEYTHTTGKNVELISGYLVRDRD